MRRKELKKTLILETEILDKIRTVTGQTVHQQHGVTPILIMFPAILDLRKEHFGAPLSE
jgi:hypothetical protein